MSPCRKTSFRFLRQRVRHILTGPLVLLAALVIAFEEFAWDELAAALARLGQLPLFRQIEGWVVRRSPHAALALFLLPLLGLLPVKLLAVLLITRGHALSGIVLVLAVKISGTAIVARLFLLTETQLMQVIWFARAYLAFRRFRDYLYGRLQASRYWRAARALIAAMRLRLSRPSRWRRLGRRLSRQWQHLRK